MVKKNKKKSFSYNAELWVNPVLEKKQMEVFSFSFPSAQLPTTSFTYLKHNSQIILLFT